MATYYIGSDVKKIQIVTLSAPSHEEFDRKRWVNTMLKWAVDRGIDCHWHGERTFYKDDHWWHEVNFVIPNEAERTMFMLRWS